jgi:predicted ATPase/DNA-binding SARP family transcriptional activator
MRCGDAIGAMSAEAVTPAVMRLELLGAPAAYWNDTPLSLPTRRSLPLLCFVALSDRPMLRAELGRLLWEMPRAVNLRQELAKLRKLPGASRWLKEKGACVALAARTDVGEFLVAARRDDHATALRIWRRDRTSYMRRDHLLFGIAPPNAPGSFYEFLDEEREHLIGLYVRALQCRAHEFEEQGAVGAALRLNRELLRLDDMNESAHRSIMQIEWGRGNLGSALHQFEACRQTLAAGANVPPLMETQELAARIRRTVAARRWRHHDVTLANATPFIGREAELQAVNDLLSTPECRIVSVLGSGGVGKTRLALEVARRRAEAFQHGVCYVRLETVREPDHLPFALAHAMNLKAPPWPTVARHVADRFRTRSMLLVADGLELLPAASEYFASLMRVSPGSKLLVTSRRCMYLPGEHLFQIGGMRCPGSSTEPYAVRYDAVALFLQVARRVLPDFAASSATLPHLVRIVQLVGGVPLAIEAVARWLRVLPIQLLADRLEVERDLLEADDAGCGDWHASMRMVFQASLRRLPQRQAQVLEDLAAFDGPFDSDQAAARGGAELGDLWLLLDHCFLSWDGSQFRMDALARRMILERHACHGRP